MSKKFIGISSKIVKVEDMPLHNGQILSYIDAVKCAGAIPVIIPIINNKEDVEALVSKLDAIVMTGGSDVHPDLYNEDPHPKIREISISRDKYELNIIDAALKYKKPILAICRGMQLVNIYFGGSLYQDIESQVENAISHVGLTTANDYHHRINLEEDGFLYEIFGKKEIKVSSIHHQAIKDLGDGLKVVAKANDGIIEAVENRDLKLICTQFHPEEQFNYDENFLNIYKYLIKMTDQ